MEYIINPSWIYWINVCDALKIATMVFAIFSIICTMVLAIIWCSTFTDDEDDAWFFKWMKIGLICFAIFLLCTIFIPSKETIIEMMVARLATPSNIASGVEQVKEIVDYIINALHPVTN